MYQKHLSLLTGVLLIGCAAPTFAQTMHDSTMHDSTMQRDDMHGGTMQSSGMHGGTMQGSGMHGDNMQDRTMHRGMMRASTPEATESPASQARNISEDQVLAHKMLGHINLAELALALDEPVKAAGQLDRARGIEETLAARMPDFRIDSTFEYGKVAYDDASKMRDHYIPVVDDVFLVNGYGDLFKDSKDADYDELSAGVVHLGISLDLRDVQRAIDSASAQLDENDYIGARLALNDLFKNAIVDEEEVMDPGVQIAENLALAKAFVDSKQYDSARLTLDHVQDDLTAARQEQLSGFDKSKIDDLSNELDKMRADLRKKDPTLLGRVSAELSSWGDTVAHWFS